MGVPLGKTASEPAEEEQIRQLWDFTRHGRQTFPIRVRCPGFSPSKSASQFNAPYEQAKALAYIHPRDPKGQQLQFNLASSRFARLAGLSPIFFRRVHALLDIRFIQIAHPGLTSSRFDLHTLRFTAEVRD